MRNILNLIAWITALFVVPSFTFAGTIGETKITPETTPAGVPVVATVTATISDIDLIAGSVNLQRLDANSNVTTILGTLHDDGVNGDAVANDKIYSLVTTILENTPGAVRLRVSAAFRGTLLRAFSSPLTVNITGTATGITIVAPATAAYLNTSPVTVRGTVGDAAATVTVNGVAAPVAGGTFVATVPLNEGPNTLTAVATNANGTTSTASALVTLDTTPPRVAIYTPTPNGVTTDATVTVTGMINDIVVGTVNPEQATVTVNGIAAQVLNRTFTVTNVPLAVGTNMLQARGVDRAGNSATTTITVTRRAPTEITLRVFSGNDQSGPIRSLLAAPLVAQLLNGAGQPIPNTPVVFRVTNQDGLVSPDGGAGTGMSSIAVNTDAQGLARVRFFLGSRAGAGNNVIEASATGVATTATFIASATPTAPGLIIVDNGNNQSGVIGQPLPLPLVAIVTDAGYNRLANVPVTFTIKNGGGSFAGQTTFTTTTDSDGRVMAIPTLGANPGVNNNLIEASFVGNTGFAAAFTASGLTPGPANATRITGVVLDNSNNPIPGVTMRLFHVNQGNNGNVPQQVATAVQTNAQGQFTIQPAPVGVFKLMADGGTAQRPGNWPTLEYDLVTVSGQNNTVGSPIYLPELLSNNRLCVSPTTGGTLTIPQAPGFSLTVVPGSAIFPGGSRTGCISVTPVNMDKVPMVPGFGQQPRFVVTIQPVGTIFTIPAAITIPNVDGLAPRAVTEMYSFDHDLASFVAIGTGAVSEDGSVIRSDPGVGVLKAGWHCGGNPNQTGSAGTCEECMKCEGNACVEDPSKNNTPCKNGNGRCSKGKCISVEILAADVTQDKIQIRLAPQDASGSLMLELRGPNTHTIRTENRSAGTLNETFEIPNLPNRSEFTSVHATWNVEGVTVSTNFSYHIKIHGDVRHSVYNTPYESECSGTASANVFITSIVNNTCQYAAATLNSTFKSQLDLNGSGVSIANGMLQVEALPLCLNNAPAGSQGRLYRTVSTIRPACGVGLSESTVASYRASNGGDPMSCNDRVFIYRLGAGLGTVKSVTDNCPACGPSPTYARQLDNYTSRQACNPGAFNDHGNFKTIQVY